MKPSVWQVVAIVVLLILLFGWKSLPNMARSLGQSMRIFKSEVDQMKEPSAASQDTVPGERADHESSGLRDRAADLGERARDTAEGVKDKGTSVRDEFRDGLHEGDVRGDETQHNDPRA